MKTLTLFAAVLIFAVLIFAVLQSCGPIPAQTTGEAPTVDTLAIDTTVKQVHAKVKEVKKSVQCRAITATGERCTRKTTDKTGLCWQHNPNHPHNAK